MKKLGILLLTLGIMLASSCKQKTSQKETVIQEKEGLITYKYKVVGLEDSVISDSIWRIIFQVEGIEKMVLSQDDSTALFTVDPALVSNDNLMEEIEKRGGLLLN
jgi:hypothetical protein